MLRNLTDRFSQVRSLYTSSPYFSSEPSDEEFDFRDVELASQPEWSRVLNRVKHDATDIQERMKILTKLHAEHITHRTGKSISSLQQEEIEIEAHTAEIHRLFQICKNNITNLDNGQSKQENVLLNNIRMKLVTEIADLSKVFRTTQQKYLQGLKALKEKRREMNALDHTLADSDSDEERAMDVMLDKLDTGFSEEQMEFLIQNERDVLRRDKELKEILKSIYELQELFKDFSQLVVEQGTMLDRIDFNIERTQTYFKQGNKMLERSETIQKCNRWLMCLIFLVVVVAVIASVLVMKLGFQYIPTILRLIGL